MHRLLLLAVGFFTVGFGVSSGQTAPAPANIRVRLLNYKTGRPLKGRYVALSLSSPDGKYLRADVVREKTDADGVARFWFEATPPPRLWVVALDDYACAEQEEFATADILQHGIAGSYADDSHCKPHASSLPNPQPGEVVFPVHRLNLWQRILRGFE
jgi:hypothetical protein